MKIKGGRGQLGRHFNANETLLRQLGACWRNKNVWHLGCGGWGLASIESMKRQVWRETQDYNLLRLFSNMLFYLVIIKYCDGKETVG